MNTAIQFTCLLPGLLSPGQALAFDGQDLIESKSPAEILTQLSDTQSSSPEPIVHSRLVSVSLRRIVNSNCLGPEPPWTLLFSLTAKLLKAPEIGIICCAFSSSSLSKPLNIPKYLTPLFDVFPSDPPPIKVSPPGPCGPAGPVSPCGPSGPSGPSSP